MEGNIDAFLELSDNCERFADLIGSAVSRKNIIKSVYDLVGQVLRQETSLGIEPGNLSSAFVDLTHALCCSGFGEP